MKDGGLEARGLGQNKRELLQTTHRVPRVCR